MAALEPERLSVIAGMLTFYLVTTALLTIRRAEEFRWIDVGADDRTHPATGAMARIDIQLAERDSTLGFDFR